MNKRVVRRELRPQSHIPSATELTEEWDKRFKKAMLLAKSPGIRLDDGMRYDLAKMIPGIDSNDPQVGSWKALTESQLDVLLNMLEGYALIQYLKVERGDFA